MEPSAKRAKACNADSDLPAIPSDAEILESDLPLLANVDDVRATHYLLKLRFDFDSRVVQGGLVLFLKSQVATDRRDPSKQCSCPSQIVLDCCTLKVFKVSVLKTSDAETEEVSFQTERDWFSMAEESSESNVTFQLDPWSLSIAGWSCAPEHCKFPIVLRIDYETLPETPSLLWRPCTGQNYGSDQFRAVYTPASPVNNRGLFPCQEPPTAMATWECYVEVKKPYTPLLSSDEPAIIVGNDSETADFRTFYFRTRHVMPMSTFAVVIGTFPVQVDLIPGSKIPVRLFSVSEAGLPDIDLFRNYVRNVLGAAQSLLGAHPFARLDLVVLPASFHTLSLANPHMIFVSGSIFTGTQDPLYMAAIPHEVAHSWFGLSIGAKDWTEEWLSEGFATFVEDIVYAEAMRRTYPESAAQVQRALGLKACLRLHTLQAEIQNTSSEANSELQRLVPAGSATSVKNGRVPLKQFLQVHYLKGYFFLTILSHRAGEGKFLEFLKAYVQEFQGSLVTSTQFLNMYKDAFGPGDVSELAKAWLEDPGLPEPIGSLDVLKDPNPLQFLKGRNMGVSESLKRISKAYEQLSIGPAGQGLSSGELILLFEKVLVSPDPWLRSMKVERLGFQPEPAHNPEVLHRWAEILLKLYMVRPSEFKADLGFVRSFLTRHPAMGVYLYGELMISEDPVLQNMARELYLGRLGVLDPESRHVLHAMIY